MLRLPCPAATAFPDLLLRRAPTKPPPPPTFSAVTASCFAFPARSHRLRTTSLSAHTASLPCARSPAPLTPSTGRHLHSTATVGPSSPRLAARSSSALPPGARLPQPQTKPAATERAPSTAPAWSRSDVGGVALKEAELVALTLCRPHASPWELLLAAGCCYLARPGVAVDGGWLCYLRRSALLPALGGFCYRLCYLRCPPLLQTVPSIAVLGRHSCCNLGQC
jgi:hypothetical protein